MDYTLILKTNYADTEWTLNGDDYEGLTWLSKSKKPTKEELDAQWDEVLVKVNAEASAKAVAKVELLNRLGITAEEAQLLLS